MKGAEPVQCQGKMMRREGQRGEDSVFCLTDQGRLQEGVASELGLKDEDFER